MLFHETAVEGAFIIDVEALSDQRGFFARSWCSREFAAQRLNPRLVQCNISFNHQRGTLRGLHYQRAPFAEAKLVRCTAGAIFDVLVDLRADSPTYLKHVAVELSARNHRALYVPEGCAHGFQTLTDDTEVFYQMSEYYQPGQAAGVRWDDPAFAIAWPAGPRLMTERDRSYPDYGP
jgi:dTDP-4-dehydrorhamnose 3,5-epimerase